MGVILKKRWQSVLVAFVFAFTSVSTLLTSNALAVTGDIGSWQTATNALPESKASVGVVELNGYLYSIGGVNESSINTNTSVHYSQLSSTGDTGSWTTTTSLPEGLWYVTTAFTANGYIYAVGGAYDTTTNSVRTKVFYTSPNSNGSLGQWTTSTFDAPRGGAGVVASNNFIYLVGGIPTDNHNPDADLDAYQKPPILYAEINNNGSIDEWQTSTKNSPAHLLFPNVVTSGSYVYVVGGVAGFYARSASQSVYYTNINNDGSINPWTTSDHSLPEPSIYGATTVANGHIYHMGGARDVNLGATDAIQISAINNDGSIEEWHTSETTLPTPKVGLSTMATTNRLYTIGGWEVNNTTIPTNSVHFTALTPQTLAAPANLSAPTPTKQKPSLSWSSVSGATSYTVYRNGNSVGTSTTTSFTDTALTIDGNYTYTVSASNGSVASPQSASVSVQYDSTIPTATNGTINGWLVINWGNPVISADVSDALSGVTSGEYYIDNDPGQGNGTAMTYANSKISAQPIITTGTAGGWHTIYMRSKDAAGNWSTPTSVRFFFF